MDLSEKLGVAGILGSVALGLASLGGMITHIIHCLQNEQYILLVAGAIGAPIGVIHGWGIWFGWW